MEKEYDMLSRNSIIRLFHHAFDVVSDHGRQRVVHFLSYDMFYAPPSVIQSEIERALRMKPPILLSDEAGVLSFSKEALEYMNGEIYDGPSNKNYQEWKKKSKEVVRLREEANKLSRENNRGGADACLKDIGKLESEIKVLCSKINVTLPFWWPPEWQSNRRGGSQQQAPPKHQDDYIETETKRRPGNEIRVTKPPPTPKRGK